MPLSLKQTKKKNNNKEWENNRRDKIINYHINAYGVHYTSLYYANI